MTGIETAKMSERGQIIIPKDIRDYIGAIDSTIFTMMPLDKETVIMKKLDTTAILKDFRDIRTRINKHMTSNEINAEIRDARKSRH
ncbi:MAG: AbrB/MazE/SpoVT family DNA-binding domain-containing protein [Nanoarchaeota archaeon]